MIPSTVTYEDHEIAIIESKKKEVNFSSTTWEDDELKDIKAKIKQFYISVQSHQCPYCKQTLRSNSGRVWDIEHIIPRSFEEYFMFEPLNLCVACVDCNSRKSHKKVTRSKAKKRYPSVSSLYSIIHPHFDSYTDHIMIIREGFYYVALKPKGEKTIEYCGLNRFYEYAGYNDGDDSLMLFLTQELHNTDDINKKYDLRRKIAYLAIQGNFNE